MMLNKEQREWLERPTVLPPVLRQVEGTKYWTFVEPYLISLPPPHFPMKLYIPAGWSYDRSSIPEWFPSFVMNKDDLGTLAPSVHDAGYQCGGRFDLVPDFLPHIVLNGESCQFRASRDLVDRWFLMYLLRQRVTPWRAWSSYFAVSYFARPAWKTWALSEFRSP